jgi:hypothetical protein
MNYKERIYTMLIEAKITLRLRRPGRLAPRGSKPPSNPRAAKKAQNVITDRDNRGKTSATGITHRRSALGQSFPDLDDAANGLMRLGRPKKDSK